MKFRRDPHALGAFTAIRGLEISRVLDR